MQTFSSKSDEYPELQDGQTSGRIVANVAQELKSPLAAMAEGNKHIMSILKDVRSRLSKIPEVPEKLLLDLEDAECTLDSTSNLSHFMKMSINRCIEYSLVREHHHLNPNLVSVKLADALRLPVACVKSIDPTHVLDVKPLPSDLCTHIMADLQWLQENILLLLANAMKHSNVNPGHTTLSLSLRTSSSLREEFAITPVAKDKISPTLLSNAVFSGDDCVMLYVEVEDSGEGLSAESIETLFSHDRMQQRLAEGTGLGLLSLFKRMEALNGHCGVRARRDGKQGCLFWFAFPYIPDELSAEMQRKVLPSTEVSVTTQFVQAEKAHFEVPDHDVLNSTLKNVLPSPMLFEPSDSHDKFNAFAPFPVYTKKSSSRSLRSAMNNLPTTVQSGGHINIASSDSKNTSGNSLNTVRINNSSGSGSDKLYSTSGSDKFNSNVSNNLNSNSGNNSSSGHTEGRTPISKWDSVGTSVYDTNSIVPDINRLSTGNSHSTDAAFSRSNSGNNRNSRTLMLNLPSETPSRPISISSSTIHSNNVGSASSGFDDYTTSGKALSPHDSFGSVRTRTDTDVTGISEQTLLPVCPPCPLNVESEHSNTTTTSTNQTDHATHTSDTSIQINNNNNSHSNPSHHNYSNNTINYNFSTTIHNTNNFGTIPNAIPYTSTNSNTTTATTSTNVAPNLTYINLHTTPPQLRTMEPSPASSTGTPHRATVDNGWKPDSLSFILTHIYNILLVEDSPMVLKMTSNILTRQGFNVTTAENGAQALDLMLHNRYEVILMDLQMPVLDGLKAARRIRELEQESGDEPRFLIAVSANSDKMIVMETLGAGFDNYIEKPFTIEQFQSVSSKYLMKKYL